jgi:hypothetical protein
MTKHHSRRATRPLATGVMGPTTTTTRRVAIPMKVGQSIPFAGFASAIEVREKSPFEKCRPIDSYAPLPLIWETAGYSFRPRRRSRGALASPWTWTAQTLFPLQTDDIDPRPAPPLRASPHLVCGSASRQTLERGQTFMVRTNHGQHDHPNHARRASRLRCRNPAWATLRSRGVDYGDVLAGLGDLGLRPPLAPMEGPNLEPRQRGMRRLRELLARPRPRAGRSPLS